MPTRNITGQRVGVPLFDYPCVGLCQDPCISAHPNLRAFLSVQRSNILFLHCLQTHMLFHAISTGAYANV